GRQDERDDHALFAGVQPGRDEQPGLHEQEGRSNQQPDQPRELHAEHEAGHRLGVHEVPAVLAEVLDVVVEQRLPVEESDAAARNQHVEAVKDPPAQLVEMLEERHPRAVVELFVVAVLEQAGPRRLRAHRWFRFTGRRTTSSQARDSRATVSGSAPDSAASNAASASGADVAAGSVAGGGVAGVLAARAVAWRRSSMRISSSRVLRSSFDARLNSDRLLPSDRPSSGSLRGPKTISATTKMTTSSQTPRGPIASRSLLKMLLPSAI